MAIYSCHHLHIPHCLNVDLIFFLHRYNNSFLKLQHVRSVAGYNPTSGKNAEINISEGPKPKTPKNLSRNADEDASTDDDEIYDDTNKNNNRKVPTSPSSRTVDRSQMVMASDCRLQFHVFDLPVYDGKDLSKLPYYARRTMLAHILRADSDTDGQDAPDASGIGNSSANSGADAASAAGAASDVAAGGAPSWESEDILWDEDDIPAVNTANHRNSHANGGNQNISSTRDTSNPAIDVSGRDGALGDDERLPQPPQGVVLCHQFLLHTDRASSEDLALADMLNLTRVTMPSDPESVENHLLACLAASELRENEGLVMKSLTSTYQLGPNRSTSWLKLKRDLIGQGPSADCVLIGLDQSSRRTNHDMDKFIFGLPAEQDGRRTFYSFVRLGNLSAETRARLRRMAGDVVRCVTC